VKGGEDLTWFHLQNCPYITIPAGADCAFTAPV
jgi:hypothetical protein